MDSSALKEAIKRATSFKEIAECLAHVEFQQISGPDISVINRRIKKLGTASDLRVAYLGNQTIEPLPDYVNVRCAREGLLVDGYAGPFNQYFQEVLNHDSELHRFRPDVIFVALSLRELAPRLHYQFASLSEEAKNAEFSRIIQNLREWTEAAKQATDALLVISNFSAPAYNQLGIADLKLEQGETKFYLRLNLALMELFRADSRAQVLDLDRVLSRFGKLRACNPQMQYLARMEWHERLLPHIADELFRYINALLGRSKKCLVVDLDNTLWGGVLGEEGPEGVAVGNRGAHAEAYQAFQHAVLALKERGIILAINSKNNRDDVIELFERREMPLKLNDFSAIEINWTHKHENLKRIAEALNIGVDSLVFVDDNPAECALVRELLPEVKVIELPRDPAHFPDLIKALPEFEKLEITREDRDKARQYLENRQRSESQEEIGSLEAYLRELKTEITIRAPSQSDAARIHQLFTKTNQFNLTTKRYTGADIEKFLSDSKYVMRIVDVKDRFGELGTVGLVLTRWLISIALC
jgi:FkbH-like protein